MFETRLGMVAKVRPFCMRTNRVAAPKRLASETVTLMRLDAKPTIFGGAGAAGGGDQRNESFLDQTWSLSQ